MKKSEFNDEVWKKHPYLDCEVSTKQRVRTLKGKILTRSITETGQVRISIKGSVKSLPRLIAETYIDDDIDDKLVLLKNSDLEESEKFHPDNLLIVKNLEGRKFRKWLIK